MNQKKVCFKNNDPIKKKEINVNDVKDNESQKHRITIFGSHQFTDLAFYILDKT